MGKNMVAVLLDKRILDALRDVLQQTNEYIQQQFAGDADEPKDGYASYDETMADWREDIHCAAEALVGSIQSEGR